MKKTMVTILIVSLLLGVLTGCGRSNDDNTNAQPNATNSPETIVPGTDNGMADGENGMVNDNDGIIDNGNGSTQTDVPDEGILPEIGEGIEEGTNDVIDGMENGMDDITGNDNGNSNANGSASRRNRSR